MNREVMRVEGWPEEDSCRSFSSSIRSHLRRRSSAHIHFPINLDGFTSSTRTKTIITRSCGRKVTIDPIHLSSGGLGVGFSSDDLARAVGSLEKELALMKDK
jgi:hypothetical protein